MAESNEQQVPLKQASPATSTEDAMLGAAASLDTEAAGVLARLVIDRLASSPVDKPKSGTLLRDAVRIGAEKVLRSTASDGPVIRDSLSVIRENRNAAAEPRITNNQERLTAGSPILIVLAAGKGTRFGQQPKCIQPVLGVPLARHSIEAFRRVVNGYPLSVIRKKGIEGGDPLSRITNNQEPVTTIAIVGYKHDEVSSALGTDNTYVLSENPTGGTAFAAYEAFSAPGLVEANPLLVITMGDRVVPESVFRRLLETHVDQRSDVRDQRSDVRDQRSDVRDQRSGENRTGSDLRPLISDLCQPDLRPLISDLSQPDLRPLTSDLTQHVAEADLTFLTARYEPPKHRGKGRVLRNAAGKVVRIVEQNDISAEKDPLTQQALESLTEGNCPLYAIRAATLFRLLGELDNGNAQGQYYLTDIVARIAQDGGVIRTITTSPSEPEYDLLCSDVTRPQDLAVLEGVLARQRNAPAEQEEIARAAALIRADRPPGQVASIARQLEELHQAATRDKLGYEPDKPVAIGISGGRLRIAFMHPDMGRFFGPAWQMPIGAADAKGNEQIVVLAQATDDNRLHLHPLDPKYRENVNFVAADDERMYPGENVADWHTYEGFGTRMSESLLLSLGYFSDEEIEARRKKGQPLPPPSLRVSDNMRRPFSLVGNAIASMRTLREGHLGAKVQAALGRGAFAGMRIACTGGIPMGGFSSSSALTVATKNALNSLFDLGIPADVLVHLACQAEYGTGVRAGSLDQATEQKGKAGQGTLISSNPRDNYKILGTYKVPAERFKVIFPYTVERDRAAWKWSWGVAEDGGQRAEDRGQTSEDRDQRTDDRRQRTDDRGQRSALRPLTSDLRSLAPDLRPPKVYAYAESATAGGPLTTTEVRKMTGKAAEIAAILTRLPLDTDFFKEIEADLLDDGELTIESRRWICGILTQLPLLISRDELQRRVTAQRDWYIGELVRVNGLDPDTAAAKTDATFASLFAGWREPVLRRAVAARGRKTEDRGQTKEAPSSVLRPPSSEMRIVTESGVPLRSMLAYLFCETAKCFHLIHHPEDWIEYVTRSQQGDRSVQIDFTQLPDRAAMESEVDWEKDVTGPDRLDRWLERLGAVPYDFNQGLDDASFGPFATTADDGGRKTEDGGQRTEDGRRGPEDGSALGPQASVPSLPSSVFSNAASVLSPQSSVLSNALPGFHHHPGGNFFRGLALIDLAEAMLKRAFGETAVAVRVNAAGQGDYFQVHVDGQQAGLDDVKQFLRLAFYRRFGLLPDPEFVETNSGAGAVGGIVSRFDVLPRLVLALQRTR